MPKRWKQRKRNRVHAENSLAAQVQWKNWKRETNRVRHGSPVPRLSQDRHHRSPLNFRAPETLSILEAPDESISFFRRLQGHAKRRDVFVDLSGVERITPDAVALLVAIVRMLGNKNQVRVSGSYPKETVAMETIRSSGFDQYLRSSLPSPSAKKGAIVRLDRSINAKRADAHYASELIDFASDGDGSRLRLKISYGHLLECMGNTHQHAGVRPGDEPWWASVYRDAQRKCDCFTFIDMGVGIFESAELSIRLRMYNLIDWLRPRILRALLEGKIPSSTGQPYRGRGLPSIYRSCLDGKIQRLIIVTNDVRADATLGSFSSLPAELQGVLLYWEVPHERS